MKLVVLGANGRTGRHVVRLALERGAHVTAVVRSEDKVLDTQHAHLLTSIGDPCDPRFLAELFAGEDVVISTLGGRSPTKKATSIYPRSAHAIAQAAHEAGLRKVVVTSSALLFPQRTALNKLLKVMVGNVVRSATEMEQTLANADLDTLAARCGFLTDDDETHYRCLPDDLPKDGSSVSRLSLANFLLDKANSEWSGHQVFGVSGSKG